MVNETPAVSIAIRAFRREWLPGAIESVLAQSWRDLELVVYDDARDLDDVVRRFDDPRVRYVRAERKLGASGRYSAALALCRGRYVGLLDDDDRYDRRFVETLVASLEENPRAGAACCRAMRERDGVRSSEQRRGPAEGRADFARRILIDGWVATPSTVLLRRAAFDEGEAMQPMPDGVAPDVFVSLRLELAGWRHVDVDEALVIRGWHPDQVSKSLAVFDLAVATFQQIRIGDPELERLRRRRLAACLLIRARQLVLAGRSREAWPDIRAARQSDPSLRPGMRRLTMLAAATPLLGVAAARAARAIKQRFAQE